MKGDQNGKKTTLRGWCTPEEKADQCERDYQRFHHAEESISEVNEPGSAEEHDVLDALTKQVKSNNIVPPGVQEAYTEAIMQEYHAARKKD